MYKRELHVYKLRYVRDILNQARNLNRTSLTKEKTKNKTKQNKQKHPNKQPKTTTNKNKKQNKQKHPNKQPKTTTNKNKKKGKEQHIISSSNSNNSSDMSSNEFTATTGNLPTCTINNHKFKVLGLGISFFSLFFFFTNANNVQPFFFN